MQKGQTLIEAIVALSVLLLILAASSVAIVTAVNNASYERNQTTANKLAQEGIEYIRNYKNNNTAAFAAILSTNTMVCLDQFYPVTTPLPSVQPTPANCGFIQNTYFRRYAEFRNSEDTCSPDDITDRLNPIPGIGGAGARVTVEWESGKCTSSNPFCNKTIVRTCF